MFKTSVRMGNSLEVQQLGLWAFTAVGAVSVPGTKITRATWCGQKETQKEMLGNRQQTPLPNQWLNWGMDIFRLFRSLKSWDLGLSRAKALKSWGVKGGRKAQYSLYSLLYSLQKTLGIAPLSYSVLEGFTYTRLRSSQCMWFGRLQGNGHMCMGLERCLRIKEVGWGGRKLQQETGQKPSHKARGRLVGTNEF